MSCSGDKKPEEKKEEESSGGFFSWFSCGSSSTPAEESKAPEAAAGGCGGTQNNAALREHLKQCCGLGTLPPLITTCPAVKPASDNVSSGNQDDCTFPPVNTNCSAAITDENRPPATACGDKAAKDRLKCAMPATDTSSCIPVWVCPPMKSAVRTYPAPAGVAILPMSSNKARVSSNRRPQSAKCGACGSIASEESLPEPKVVNKNCPMVRPRTCDSSKPSDAKAEDGESFIAKLGALFGKK